MGRFKVVVKEDDKLLISADKLFLSEILTSVTPNIPREYMDYYDLNLGKLSKIQVIVIHILSGNIRSNTCKDFT